MLSKLLLGLLITILALSCLGCSDRPTTNFGNADNGTVVDSNATVGERNALRSAQNYLNVMAFSYSGLIKQLEYEKYTTEEATYAADNCGADWNEQAAKKAKEYLDTMPFSRDGLIDQLEYEGFTKEQAIYGVESNGL